VRFVHIPKTGTSFIITLRNHLVACKTKDYSCTGILGGGFYGFNNPAGTGDSPFFGGMEDDDEHCGGVLQACQGDIYHEPFASPEVGLRRPRPLPHRRGLGFPLLRRLNTSLQLVCRSACRMARRMSRCCAAPSPGC
jgi:hypothetical protein